MKKLLLLFLCITSSASASWTDQLYQAFFAASLAHSVEPYLNMQSILDTYYKKIDHEKLLEFAKKECKEVTDKAIHFYVGDGRKFGMHDGNLAFALGDKTIVITSGSYAFLEQIFNKEVLTQQDEGTLDIFRFILQHEVGHLVNNDNRSRVMAFFSATIAKMLIFELSKDSLRARGSHLASVMILNFIGTYILAKINKVQEYRADRSIKTKDALSGGKQLCNNVINLKKTNEEQYWKELFSFTHPTSEDRLKCLEALPNFQQEEAVAA